MRVNHAQKDLVEVREILISSSDMNQLSLLLVKYIVDGKWGDWSPWSVCESNCKKTRSRSCDNPVPVNGGRDCVGEGRNITDCSGDYLKLMVNGEIGVLGLIVEMIVRKQDPDHVTILPQ